MALANLITKLIVCRCWYLQSRPGNTERLFTATDLFIASDYIVLLCVLHGKLQQNREVEIKHTENKVLFRIKIR